VPYINYENREVVFKLVYYGPGMSGKTSNLAYVHRVLAKHAKSDLIVLDTAQERTLFFDFFPMELGTIQGYELRFYIYTVPGQVYYEASRKVILEGADGIVFVADSQPHRLKDNLESYALMTDHLRGFGVDPKQFPIVLQYNKRDCHPSLRVGTLEAELGLGDAPVFEAIASEGVGVMETIRAAGREVVRRFEV
jgi:mutual gliding-motility protein MglA